MAKAAQTVPVPKAKLWTGRILSGIVVVFLLMDSAMKFVKPAPVIEACTHLGLPGSLISPLGVVLLASTIFYAVPPTSLWGAVLLTGYLGGAIAILLRVGDPLFSHVLFPLYLGVFLWAGLYLRDERVRALFAAGRLA